MTNPVNEVLTPKRPKKRVETSEYAGMVRRVIKALARRAGDCDVEALADMIAARQTLDSAIAGAVIELHNVHGYSWAEIGQRLGLSKQAVQQRWGR